MNLTETEAEELVTELLDSTEDEKLVEEHLGSTEGDQWLHQVGQADLRKEDNLDQFYIVCWDTVTGEGSNDPWQFSGLLAALRDLSAFEREHDRHHRVEGAVSCGHIGFSGSGDAEFEDHRSNRFRLGLRRLALRVLRRGYRPDDATDLVALCNGLLNTLHVEYAGYAKDLLWASSSEQEEPLLDVLGIEEEQWRLWAGSADAHVDVAGRKLVVDRIGEATWKRLLPKVRHFLATALLKLEEQGHAPQLDYAPISIELVKALEVELREVLVRFRQANKDAVLVHDEDNFAECSLKAFLEGKAAPTLGAMAYLFRSPSPEASALRLALHRHIDSLPNGTFLASNKFVNRGLQRVINKYRNGGVHDSPISEETCQECLEALIGNLDTAGYIPQVVAWKG